MPIPVRCSCGNALTVPNEYAGKRVKCKRCSKITPVPTPSPGAISNSPKTATKSPAKTDGLIRFNCTCGSLIKAKQEYAGRVTNCPGCKAKIKVPGSTGKPDDRMQAAPGKVGARAGGGLMELQPLEELEPVEDIVEVVEDDDVEVLEDDVEVIEDDVEVLEEDDTPVKKKPKGKSKKKVDDDVEVLEEDDVEVLEEDEDDRPSKKKGKSKNKKHDDVEVLEDDDIEVLEDDEDDDRRGKKKGSLGKKKHSKEDDLDDFDDDEDDDPKKKKKGKASKKKQSRSPVLMIVLIAVGSLLLIGGGVYGIWMMMSGSSAKSDLAYVPGDAPGFLSLRVASLWNAASVQEGLRQARQQMPGLKDPLREMEDKIGLTAPEIENLTAVMSDTQGSVYWTIISTGKPYDRKKILSKLNNPSESKHEGTTIYSNSTMTVCFTSDRQLLMGSNSGVTTALTYAKGPKRTGPLDEAMALVNGSNHFVLGFQITPAMAQQAKAGLQGPLKAGTFLTETQSGSVVMNLTDMFQLDVVLKFPDDAKAQTAKGGLDGFKGMGQLMLPGLKTQPGADPKGIDELIAAVNGITIDQQGNKVSVKLKTKASTTNLFLNKAGGPK